MVRPLGGSADEGTGILTSLEPVEPATFSPPDPAFPGDYRSARLLRDALRLGFRSSAGPFRSLGAIAVEPRPYQLVPLLMALRLDPVRLLVADDVGIGKTIEAALIARELLEQGDVRRMAVLCPPHLAEQWKEELDSKFHIDAELVLASTAARLERGLPVGTTIFQQYPHVIVSTDFIKADRHRDDFIRTCPEFVIVDEAHTCAADLGPNNRSRHQRHELVSRLAADANRHMVLVTATPHSGKEGAFRSLLTLLDPSFSDLPDDLSGDHNRRHREQLARHLVQRRRADIAAYLGANTTFPERKEGEYTHRLSAPYRALFDEVLAYAREIVRDPAEGRHRQRVRWWSALALLRSIASSPAAAAATLRTRAASATTATVEEADAVGRQTVLDTGDDDGIEATDVVAGGDADDGDDDKSATSDRRRLRAMAKKAEALHGKDDVKLQQGLELIGKLVQEGHQPIVFCRFIPTAEYVADAVRHHLRRADVFVEAITGNLPAAEREARIEAMGQHERRVLVATDCLSEGINLQDLFDAVVHYDLPWNPTRLEQREGRVDRFGQAAPTVRIATYYGVDNGIDQIVLDVLLRKHRKIRSALGVSIPVPGDTNAVIEAVAEGLLMAETGPVEQVLPGMEEFLKPRTADFLEEWDRAAEQEQRSRTVFAQHGIKVDEVAPEVEAVRAAVGSGADVEAFVRTATTVLGGTTSGTAPVTIDLSGAQVAVRDAIGVTRARGRFAPPVRDDELLLGRTHPLVNGLASYLMTAALDAEVDSPARRCGVIKTSAVTTRTTLLLVRHRFHLLTIRGGVEEPLLAEDCATLAFTGSPDAPVWLPDEEVESLLLAEPTDNVHPAQATDFLSEVLAKDAWRAQLVADAQRRAE
ncbi:MAG: DEAD/DEAH box helicase family protein, partial [Acidimicrobiales bacterium]|nr:DEAD/DEAH box helicase family protein [Acidimicrobiales bacterium]